MKKKKIPIIFASVLLLICLSVVIGLGSIYIFARNNTDFSADENLFRAVKENNTTKFYYDASYGTGEYIPKEFCLLENAINKREWYSYDKIGENIKSAFISAEDRRFFEHHGVDFKRTALAIVNYFFKIKPKFGASTITQQVIKNISGNDEQTVSRKLAEIIRARNIENAHSKEEIFEVYLNIIPLGDGITGVGYGSRYYFGKTPETLSIAEAATLAAITNAPARYNPHKNPDACIKKRNKILYAMRDFGKISDSEYEAAISDKLNLSEAKREDSVNSWFVETVCDDVAADLASQRGISKNAARLMVFRGGLSIYTTVDPEIQEALENYFENESNFPSGIKSGLNYSMVVTDSRRGRLLGIVGSVGKKSGNRILNYATVANTPGSALKPIALYAPLLNSGRANWATVFDDVPVSFTKDKSGEYIEYPRNFPRIYDGLTTFSDALRYSKNTVAVRMYKMLGANRIFNSLKENFYIDTLVESSTDKNGNKLTDKDIAPLALGQLSYGVSLRKLTEAYTVFPSDGVLTRGRSYVAVYDSNKNLLLENKESENRIFSAESARIMNQMLSRVVESGTAKSITLKNIIDTAGKTGTSGNDKDRLFVGYTPYYTAGIWCGYTEGENSIGNVSVSHIQIWDNIMKEIHEIKLSGVENPKNFSKEGLEYLPYCKDSGKLYTQKCLYDPRNTRLEYGYFTPDNRPSGECDRHVLCLYDELTGAVAVKGCPKENLKVISLLDIPERKFPKEVYITDAEYVYRYVSDGVRRGDSYDLPYYVYMLEDGEFIGKSKGKKQFNSSCYLHDD